MTPDDLTRMEQIQEAVSQGDDFKIARNIRSYYADMDRSRRTPREILYLHLGILSGIVLRLTTPRG